MEDFSRKATGSVGLATLDDLAFEIGFVLEAAPLGGSIPDDLEFFDSEVLNEAGEGARRWERLRRSGRYDGDLNCCHHTEHCEHPLLGLEDRYGSSSEPWSLAEVSANSSPSSSSDGLEASDGPRPDMSKSSRNGDESLTWLTFVLEANVGGDEDSEGGEAEDGDELFGREEGMSSWLDLSEHWDSLMAVHNLTTIIASAGAVDVTVGGSDDTRSPWLIGPANLNPALRLGAIDGPDVGGMSLGETVRGYRRRGLRTDRELGDSGADASGVTDSGAVEVVAGLLGPMEFLGADDEGRAERRVVVVDEMEELRLMMMKIMSKLLVETIREAHGSEDDDEYDDDGGMACRFKAVDDRGQELSESRIDDIGKGMSSVTGDYYLMNDDEAVDGDRHVDDLYAEIAEGSVVTVVVAVVSVNAHVDDELRVTISGLPNADEDGMRARLCVVILLGMDEWWVEQLTQVTTDTKNTQKRVGTGWDGRRSTQDPMGRAQRRDKEQLQGRQKANIDASASQRSMAAREDSGEVSVGLVRRWLTGL
ncbi:hypothetical protein PPACK8108_LOCUS25168 [Phakopsora pachyrhizi]|uniref:Uncharacterized protein n=1 Tax=Phakopsora pachyrhizi TaxID=170000 RepID=A0AAV0BUQ2_PHAPC|nr:hypothetical protein PPACK8108_LOCUS25168 [Phakopsora pachyrhizi]